MVEYMKKKVSIIVPIYNSEKYIKSCVESLINQTYHNIEILLVDDGSKDNSFNICSDFTDNRIKIYKKDNGGVSSARNFGLQKATGYYVTFVDSDDLVEKDYVDFLVKAISDDGVDLSICNFYSHTKNKNEFLVDIISQEETFYNILNDTRYSGYVWNKLYKLNIIRENKLSFNEKISVCEDFLFNCYYISYIKRVAYVDSQLYWYNCDNESSATYNKYLYNPKKASIIDSYKEIINIYEKHSNSNIIFVYYHYLKILLHYKYIYKINNIKFPHDNDIKFYWNIIRRNAKIDFKRKIVLYFRVKFPYISAGIKRRIAEGGK